MKMKTLAAAVVLATATGTTNAALVEGLSQFVDSEMYLSVFYPSAETSYHMDLGITLSEFNADDSSARSFDLASDPNFASYLGQTGLRYSITAANNILNGVAELPTFGFMTTTAAVASLESSMVNLNSINGAASAINRQANSLNTASGEVYSGTNGGINSTATVSIGQPGYYNVGVWGDTMGNRGFNMAADVDSSVGFYQVTLSEVDFESPVVTYMGDWNLSSDGALTYGDVSAVPVPAAVWLFGSGLVGLVGIARRKKA